MQEQKQYAKLSALVGNNFTIKSVGGFLYKKWDPANNKMVSEDNWFEGARKMFPVETDKGLLDLSESQLGSILAGVQHAGQANVINVTVAVKSNGKSGIDIRYYLNPQRTAKPQESPEEASQEVYQEEDIAGLFDRE